MRYRKFRKFRRFPTRSVTRRGPKVEVSNYAVAYQQTATSQIATLADPSIYVTPIMSLASLVTDQDVSNVLTRSIPPQYRGVSIKGGTLAVNVSITGGPTTTHAEQGTATGWAGGWLYAALWLYVDNFVWDQGLEQPNLEVLHPWQNDLIAGSVHSEFNRPKRILRRIAWHMPGAIDSDYNGDGELISVQNRGALTRTFNLKVPKCYLNERETLWFATFMTNPWTLPNYNINLGISAMGPVAYRLRTS